jgi:ATP-dependent DNA helicase DinG
VITFNTRPLDHFPKREPREKQAKALEFLLRAIERGYKHVVIAAPTGIGKSAIGVAICNWAATTGIEGAHGGYYLVTQKLLQDQLSQDFIVPPHKCDSLKSATEYDCAHARNCAAGAMAKVKCNSRIVGTCPYLVAKNAFLNSRVSVTNYPYFMTERIYVRKFQKRQILVCDEAHSVERQIIRFMDITITEELLTEWAPNITLPKLRNIDEFKSWVEKSYLPEVIDKLEGLVAVFDGTDEKIGKLIAPLEQHIYRIKHSLELITENPDDWVYWQERDKNSKLVSICRPLTAAPFTQMLFDSATVKVYMSAYPGSKEVFCRSLGIEEKDVAWCSLNSTFPIENRPIVLGLVGSMSMRNIEESLPAFFRTLDKLMMKHGNEKGIIHTNSYKLGNLVLEHYRGTESGLRLLFPENGEQREAKFTEHRTSPSPTVIISPSMTEGFDFAEDLARWQVIAKIPYPSLSDKQIVAKKALDEDWYATQTVMTLIQTCGRVCRSDTDWGVTYILDSDFNHIWKRNSQLFPTWFSRAFVWPKKR